MQCLDNAQLVKLTPFNEEARCSSMVESPLMVQWVVGSIPHGGLIELFLDLASAP